MNKVVWNLLELIVTSAPLVISVLVMVAFD